MSLLKFQNVSVLGFDFTQNYYKVLNENFLPVILRGRIKDPVDLATLPVNEQINALIATRDAIMEFFTGRHLDVSRVNAKRILNTMGIAQTLDKETCLKMMFLCKGLSAADDYWLTNYDSEKWEDVNLRDNPLHETLAHIALFGDTTISITGEVRTPEFTNQGTYPKAWRRKKGKLYLYKGSHHDRAAEQEVCTSKILDYTNVPHVQYWLETIEGKQVSVCECMCTNDRSIVTAYDFIRWNKHMGIDVLEKINETDEENFNKMLVTDYLIANSDRHSKNWGFFMDAKTGNLVSLHPLFDHNLSFDRGTMAHPAGGVSLLFPKRTKLEVAKDALNGCDFQIAQKIPEVDFLESYHASLFESRCKRLGLNVVIAKSYPATDIKKQVKFTR